jgi:hypothetical protein
MKDTVYCRGPFLWVRSDKPQRLGFRDLQRHLRIGPEPSPPPDSPRHRPSLGTRRDWIQVDVQLGLCLACQVMATHPSQGAT